MKKILLALIVLGGCVEEFDGTPSCRDVLPATATKDDVMCPDRTGPGCTDDGHYCICHVTETKEACWADLGDIRETNK